jgi:hypothetical protein
VYTARQFQLYTHVAQDPFFQVINLNLLFYFYFLFLSLSLFLFFLQEKKDYKNLCVIDPLFNVLSYPFSDLETGEDAGPIGIVEPM